MGAFAPGWCSGPLQVARTRAERWRGLRPRPCGRGLLLATRSVHTWGMREALLVVSLDDAGRVRRTRLLAPGRLFFDAGACWVVELPKGRRPPPVGGTLALLRRIIGGSPGSG